MSARMLLAVFDSVYLVALTAWVGSVLFFSIGVAPILFPVLGVEAGGVGGTNGAARTQEAWRLSILRSRRLWA